MKRLLICVLLLVLGLAGTNGWGQSAGANAGAVEADLLLTAPAPTAEVIPAAAVLLQQTGGANQLPPTQAGAGNLVNIVQAGTGNSANVSQAGAGLTTVVIQQGDANEVESQLLGTNLETQIRQEGDFNQIRQRISGDDQRYIVEQRGQNNQVDQQETWNTGPGYEIYQQGNNMRVRVEQGLAIP